MKLHNNYYTDHISFFYKFLKSLYAANIKNESPYRRKILEMSATATEYLFYFDFLLYASSGLALNIVPVITYFIRGEIVPIVPLMIPGVDETTLRGMCITTAYHVVTVFFTCYGLAIIDLIYAIPVIHSLMVSELINDEIYQLNEYLVQSKVDRVAVKVKFRNILLMHKEMAVYVEHSRFFLN